MKTSANNRSTTKSDIAIGQRIRTARLESKMSQTDLGETMNISFQQIQKYENGKNRVSARDIVLIAKALNKPVDYFVGELDVRQSISAQRRATFLASREGNLIIDVTMGLPQAMQQAIITLARNLAHG